MYDDIYSRNKGYVSANLQDKIRASKILVAGCGIGSQIAEVAMRVGFERMTLADGDTIEIHNLNRQAYSQSDIGDHKVTALSKRLKNINPESDIKEFCKMINNENVADLVNDCDLIFDTIDFLDVKTITALHDEANNQKKPLISAVSVGWGGAAVYFQPNGTDICTFRRLFGMQEHGAIEEASHVQLFPAFIEKIKSSIDPASAQALADTLQKMENGIPCPAPHVAVGAMAVASLVTTMAVRILNGDKVMAAPHLALANMGSISSANGIDLSA